MKTHIWFKLILSALIFSGALQWRAEVRALSFSNPAAINIPALGSPNATGNASPYPSTITISGISGRIFDVNVALLGLTHTSISDVGVLLVGPGGQKVVLMNDVGDLTSATNVNVTLDDQAAGSLPSSSAIASGTFKPTNGSPADVFPAPAPGGPYGSLLSVFNNALANGTWSLFIEDFSAGDIGSLNGGWRLDIATTPEPLSLILLGIGFIVVRLWLKKRGLGKAPVCFQSFMR
jgi:subtilisin-like proprotein convertase family protein